MPEAALAPGSTLDRYELLCPLAEGGMATVWLARMRGKRGFEKLVAIKTIKSELVDDPRFEEMFLDEARIASGITHPNVAQIIDLGEKSGVLYLVMEWVDGESLAKVRKFAAKARVRVPLGLSLRIIADASAGLHAAHELKGSDGLAMGVVHRDVSPQNILISTGGAVKVIDFGIAKAQNRLGTRTRTGVVKGKVQYMAPEQAKGDAHDRRVDVWALGVCLYELISDRLPFDGDNPLEVLSRITSYDPPPIEGELPPGVREVIAGALARDPEERFQTAAALRRAIENVLTQLGESVSSEDVAAFVEAYMPARAVERQEIVAQALREAETRAPGGVDVFTGTMEVYGARGAGQDSSGRIRSSGSHRTVGATPPRASRPQLPGFSARALIEEEPKSKAPLWILFALILLGGGGFLVWQNPPWVRPVTDLFLTPAADTPPVVPSSLPSASASAADQASASASPASSTVDVDALPSATSSAEAAPASAPSASAAPSAAPPKHRTHGWPSPAPSTPAVPRNNDWLPKESVLPQIAPKPATDPAN
jgi:eukaryotic-like serine/threonine-protein kinase